MIYKSCKSNVSFVKFGCDQLISFDISYQYAQALEISRLSVYHQNKMKKFQNCIHIKLNIPLFSNSNCKHIRFLCYFIIFANAYSWQSGFQSQILKEYSPDTRQKKEKEKRGYDQLVFPSFLQVTHDSLCRFCHDLLVPVK